MKEIINIINKLENESEEDKEQIKRALKCTKYKLCGDYTTTPISRKEAIEILGKEMFASGLERSSFHWTAARTNKDKTVLFDSSDLFKDW